MTITLTGGTIQIGKNAALSLIVSQRLTMSSQFVMAISSSITVSGICPDFSQSSLTITDIDPNSQSKLIPIIYSGNNSCISQFRNVTTDNTGCARVQISQQISGPILSISYLIDSSSCTTTTSTATIAAAITGGVVFLVILVVVLVLVLPKFKEKIFPYRNREFYDYNSKSTIKPKKDTFKENMEEDPTGSDQ